MISSKRELIRALIASLFFSSSRARGNEDEASLTTDGRYNGRAWSAQGEQCKLWMVIGIHDGFTDCLNTADVFAADDKPMQQRLNVIRNKLYSRFSFGEAVRAIDQFYAEPANAVIPVSEMYVHSIRKFNGESANRIETEFTNLRKLYSSLQK